MDFLNENATFVCSAGGVIQCKDGGNSNVRGCGAALLTVSATVKSKKGICAILTAEAQGTPQPCKCQLTAWSGSAPNKFSNGKTLLLQTAKNTCGVAGGIISATKSGVSGCIKTGMILPADKKISAKAVAESVQAAAQEIRQNLFCPYNSSSEKCRSCAYPQAGTNTHKIFAPHVELVRLANFYGYDINNALNCIRLVSAELDKIEMALRWRAVCRNTDRQKAAFLQRMNNLAAKVKAKLAAFTDKPQRSFPYYVSNEAYAFAFDLPRTVKIVLLSRAGDGFVFEKFRAGLDGNLVFKSVEAKSLSNPKSFALDTPRSKIESIVFCENVELFVLADGVEFDDINFLQRNENLVRKIGGGVEDGTKFLMCHEAEIVVWAREMRGKYQYAAPKQKIRERLVAGGFLA